MASSTPAIAVAGALAYDQICLTDKSLTDDQRPLLNRKLVNITEDFGGCGGNIAYNLALLHQSTQLLSCTGTIDDSSYRTRLEELGVDTQYCLRIEDHYCARAVIFTDQSGQQFTGFFPGPVPTSGAWQQHLAQVDWSTIDLFIQAPYPASLMHASMQVVRRQPRPPFAVFVPGQYADQLSAAEVCDLVDLADCVVGNEHEIHCLEQHHSLEDKLVIRTHGSQPIEVRPIDQAPALIDVPAAPVNVDPTGCGDAFVAAMCHHLVNQAQQHNMTVPGTPQFKPSVSELRAAVLAGCRLAAACLACPGSQQHHFPQDHEP